MGQVQDALSKAIAALPPGRVPKGFTAQARALGGRGKNPEQRIARLFAVTPRTAKGWLAGGKTTKRNQIKAQQMTDAVAEYRKTGRARAAAARGNLKVETRARFGYLAPIGTSSDPRNRRISTPLPGAFADALFDAYRIDEAALTRVVANGILSEYFRDRGRRAHDLDIVFEAIDYIEFEINE